MGLKASADTLSCGTKIEKWCLTYLNSNKTQTNIYTHFIISSTGNSFSSILPSTTDT